MYRDFYEQYLKIHVSLQWKSAYFKLFINTLQIIQIPVQQNSFNMNTNIAKSQE